MRFCGEATIPPTMCLSFCMSKVLALLQAGQMWAMPAKSSFHYHGSMGGALACTVPFSGIHRSILWNDALLAEGAKGKKQAELLKGS